MRNVVLLLPDGWRVVVVDGERGRRKGHIVGVEEISVAGKWVLGYWISMDDGGAMLEWHDRLVVRGTIPVFSRN